MSGQWLHAFQWLEEDEIGDLPASWNHLVGVDSPSVSPDGVHFTRGIPTMPGRHGDEWADAWLAVAQLIRG